MFYGALAQSTMRTTQVHSARRCGGMHCLAWQKRRAKVFPQSRAEIMTIRGESLFAWWFHLQPNYCVTNSKPTHQHPPNLFTLLCAVFCLGAQLLPTSAANGSSAKIDAAARSLSRPRRNAKCRLLSQNFGRPMGSQRRARPSWVDLGGPEGGVTGSEFIGGSIVIVMPTSVI